MFPFRRSNLIPNPLAQVDRDPIWILFRNTWKESLLKLQIYFKKVFFSMLGWSSWSWSCTGTGTTRWTSSGTGPSPLAMWRSRHSAYFHPDLLFNTISCAMDDHWGLSKYFSDNFPHRNYILRILFIHLRYCFNVMNILAWKVNDRPKDCNVPVFSWTYLSCFPFFSV